MPEYTYEDIIIDPEDPRLDGAIGKECYFGNETQHAIEDANENNNLAILEQVDSSRTTSPFCLYMPSYNDRFSVTCIILKKEEQMPEYSYKDIIIDPTSEEARNYVGKEVYFSDNISICLYCANNEINSSMGVLQGITERYCYPFRVNDSHYQVIIPKKVEQKPKPEFVPFDTIEEFVKASLEHNKNHYLAGTGIWLKKLRADNSTPVCMIIVSSFYGYDNTIFVDDNWLYLKEVLDLYVFLDDTPCGKQAE